MVIAVIVGPYAKKGKDSEERMAMKAVALGLERKERMAK